MIVRREGYGAAKADIPGDVRTRHVLGCIQRPRGHVLTKIHAEACRIPWGRAKLPPGYGSLNVSYKSIEEGEQITKSRPGQSDD